MANQAITNLTQLLLAEKEEKRQLYNRFKDLERERDGLAQMAAQTSELRQQIRVLSDENKALDKQLALLT
ncbi:MAG: hypothetical protein EOR00_09460 [Mesorhizobium sp.]|uniref:hypothetical protein n=1 Tax=Mesorhizobium sp. TaxID=1871066 RepID=UPI000FE8657E|nr:hypothetical protein [Mesorhizobium sp.]RWP18855.1 MAG: hypothetical protein EOR00_09460 [Mesorhizobium sp.]